MPDQFHHSLTKEQEPIFRGAEYRRFPYQTLNGIIYFQSANLANGNVVYYDRPYNDVRLLYDQMTDELITVDITGNSFIRLFSPKVRSFNIHGASFIFVHDSLKSATGGFWQVLINSEVKLYKKEIKTIADKIVDHKMSPVVSVQTRYRVVSRNGEHDVRDRSSLTEALADQKEAIAAFHRHNRRRFRKAGFETMATETVQYYNEMAMRK